MKSFIISLMIFSLLLSGIIVNCIYVSRFSMQLLKYSNEFPEDHMPADKEIINDLTEFWRKNEFFIMLTNDHAKIHEVYHHIQSMEAALISGNFTLYTQSRLAIAEAAKGFLEFDTFSLIGVL